MNRNAFLTSVLFISLFAASAFANPPDFHGGPGMGHPMPGHGGGGMPGMGNPMPGPMPGYGGGGMPGGGHFGGGFHVGFPGHGGPPPVVVPGGGPVFGPRPPGVVVGGGGPVFHLPTVVVGPGYRQPGMGWNPGCGWGGWGGWKWHEFGRLANLETQAQQLYSAIQMAGLEYYLQQEGYDFLNSVQTFKNCLMSPFENRMTCSDEKQMMEQYWYRLSNDLRNNNVMDPRVYRELYEAQMAVDNMRYFY